MKALSTAALTLAWIVSSPAALAAEQVVIQVPRGVAAPVSPLTRAEVLADLHMWRLSGMPEFTRNEQLEEHTDRYKMALARYHAMRASPDYRMLVEKLQGNPLTLVVGR